MGDAPALSSRLENGSVNVVTDVNDDGYGPDPGCDADLVLCAQDNFVPLSITTTTTTTTATATRAAIAYEDVRTIAVDLIHEACGWRIHAVKCRQRASSVKLLK